MYAIIIEATDAPGLGDRLRSLPALTEGTELGSPSSGRLSAVFTEPGPAIDVALEALRSPGVSVGVGISSGGPDDSGYASAYARAAVQRCAAAPSAGRAAFRNVFVEAPDPALADAATALARLLARLVGTRTEAEWRVVDLLVPGVRGQHRAVGEALGISPQAVSKALIRTGWHEQSEGRAGLVEIMRRLNNS